MVGCILHAKQIFNLKTKLHNTQTYTLTYSLIRTNWKKYTQMWSGMVGRTNDRAKHSHTHTHTIIERKNSVFHVNSNLPGHFKITNILQWKSQPINWPTMGVRKLRWYYWQYTPETTQMYMANCSCNCGECLCMCVYMGNKVPKSISIDRKSVCVYVLFNII